MEEIIENPVFNIPTSLANNFIASSFLSEFPKILSVDIPLLTVQSHLMTLYRIKSMTFWRSHGQGFVCYSCNMIIHPYFGACKGESLSKV